MVWICTHFVSCPMQESRRRINNSKQIGALKGLDLVPISQTRHPCTGEPCKGEICTFNVGAREVCLAKVRPLKAAFLKVAFVKLELPRSAPLKSAPETSARASVAYRRSALEKSVFLRFAFKKFTFVMSAETNTPLVQVATIISTAGHALRHTPLGSQFSQDRSTL